MNKSRWSGAFSAKNVATLGILTAVVLFLQIGLGALIPATTSFALVLIPIVLGSVLIGSWAGAFLGFVFALIVFIDGIIREPFTHVMLEADFFLTTLIIFVKGVAAGVLPGVVYKAFKRKDTPKKELLAVAVASIVAPVANTGLFVLGTLVFQNVYVNAFISNGYEAAADYIYFIIIGCAGVNFIIELGINVLLIPAIHTVIKVFEKRFKRG